MNSGNLPRRFLQKNLLIISAWAVIILISDLPNILWNGFIGPVPEWFFWCKVGVLAAFLGLCVIWKSIRPLWQYACVLIVFYVAFAGSTWIGDTSWWQSRFAGPRVTFTVGYAGAYIRDLGVAAAVIAAMWGIRRRRKDFFLVKGQTDAPIEPVRWLGISKGKSWSTFGWIFAVVVVLAILFPTLIALRPPLQALLKAGVLIPSILIFSAINAFTEEVYFRASLLSTLHEVVGKNHTLLISAVFFGLAHYLYGSPPGMVGLLMTGFLAWLLGKSMLETKGIFWAWFIHFLADVVIFISYAVAWVQK